MTVGDAAGVYALVLWLTEFGDLIIAILILNDLAPSGQKRESLRKALCRRSGPPIYPASNNRSASTNWRTSCRWMPNTAAACVVLSGSLPLTLA